MDRLIHTFFVSYFKPLAVFLLCMPCVWSPSQMECYTSISSDLWTTSSFNALSPQWRYRHNPWPKGRLLERGHCRLKLPTPFIMEQFKMTETGGNCSVSLKLYFPQHPCGGYQMLPDDTSSPSDSFISYPGQSMEPGPVNCPLFVVTTGDSFQEHCASMKPLFSLALFSLFNCPCPQADWVLLALLSLSLSPPTLLPSAERRHLSDRAIVSRPAHCLPLSLTVMRFD